MKDTTNVHKETAHGHKGDILVVDDNLHNLKTIEAILTEEGYEVRCVTDGKTAITVAINQPPELMLLDVLMPRMDGYEVCLRLKGREETKGFPVLFLSALTEQDDKVKGFEAGGVDFISKPVQTMELLARVRTHLELHKSRIRIQEHSALLEQHVLERTKELEEVNRRLRQAEGLAHLGHWHLDLSSNTLEWSEEVFRIFGLPPKNDTLTYEAFLAMVHPQDRESVGTLYSAAVAQGKRYEINHRIVRQDSGEERWVHEKCEHLFDDAGKVIASLGMVQDITERKRTEETVKESEETFRLIFENFPLALVHLDKDGIITACNDNLCKILGSSKERLIGFDTVHSIEDEQMLAAVNSALSGKEGYYEGEYLSITGNFCTAIRGKLGPIRADHGPIIGAIGIFEDYSKRKQAEEALRQSEKLHAEAQRIANIGHWQLDLTTNELFWSDQIFNIFELDPQIFNASYDTFLQTVHPDDREFVDKAYQDSVKDKTPYAITHRLLMADGRVKHVHEQCRTDYSQDGTPLRSLGSVQDITAQKKTEFELKESEEKFRLLYENAQAGWAFTGLSDGKMIDCNKQLAQIFGYETKEECIADWVTSERYLDPAFRKKLVAKLKQTGEIQGIEAQVTVKDGSRRWVTFASRMRPDKGYIETVVIDITEQKEREKETARLASLIQQSNDDIVITDTEGNIQYVNPAFEKITGYSLSEVKGENPRILKSGKHDQAFYKEIWDTITAGRVWTGSLINKCKDGSLIEESSSLFPVFDKDGSIMNFAAVKRDVTAQKKMEGRLHQAQKMESIGTLAGGIAHDFNNILSPIFGYTEFALGHPDMPADVKEDLQEVLQAAERARELVRQILTFSRKSDQEKQPLQLSLIIKEAIKLLRSTIPATIEIKEDIAPQGMVLADPTQIHQIVMNLCTNAYHAMRQSGGILGVGLHDVEIVETTPVAGIQLPPGNYLHLEVSDSGHGMDKQTLAKIFDPYFTTKEVGEGTGLGLAVVHGIVEEHGGVIHVYSEPGQGTTFHVYLPVADLDAEQPLPQQEKVPPSHGSERIMLVDDDEKICKMAVEILTEYGYKVTPFASSPQALHDFGEQPQGYDLLITDMTMPLMTGAELARKVMEIRALMPVILCTGHSELINREKALAMGIMEYVEKPLVMSQLLKTVRTVLDKEKNHGF